MGLGRKGHLVALAKCYIDDSSDGKQQKFVIAAGVIGQFGEWLDFDRKWRTQLRAKPSIGYFHSKEWRSLTGEFHQFQNKEKWPKPEGGMAANAKRDALRGIIEKARVRAIAVGVLVPDFERVRAAHPEAAKVLGIDPYAMALQGLVYEVAKEMGKVSTEHSIAFVSDDSSRAPIYAAVYAEFKKKNPKTAPIMAGLAHLDDKHWPGLQAADLVAHYVNGHFANWDGVTKLQRPLPQFNPTVHSIVYMGDEYLCRIVKANADLDLWPQLSAPAAAAALGDGS